MDIVEFLKAVFLGIVGRYYGMASYRQYRTYDSGG